METDKTPGSWEWLRAQGQTLDLLIEGQRAQAQRFDSELAELRDGLVDLDHTVAELRQAVAATRQVLNSLQEDGA